jgi:hypothetical protein
MDTPGALCNDPDTVTDPYDELQNILLHSY